MRELAARPQLVQIKTAWRHPKEQRPGALQRRQYRELPQPENSDAEPPCESTRTAIVVFGKRSAKCSTYAQTPSAPTTTHAKRHGGPQNPHPEMPPAPEAETDEEDQSRILSVCPKNSHLCCQIRRGWIVPLATKVVGPMSSARLSPLYKAR